MDVYLANHAGVFSPGKQPLKSTPRAGKERPMNEQMYAIRVPAALLPDHAQGVFSLDDDASDSTELPMR
jgi:hypothetical protein